MAVELIDGILESAELKRSSAKLSLYKSLNFRLADGSERSLANVAAAPAVADLLKDGVAGRFYGYKAIDHRGLLGVRTKAGGSAFAIPSGNERIMLMMAIAGLFWVTIMLLTRDAITFLGLILAILGAIGWYRYRATRLEGRRLYDADAAYPAG